jgi:hypothetical protein
MYARYPVRARVALQFAPADGSGQRIPAVGAFAHSEGESLPRTNSAVHTI